MNIGSQLLSERYFRDFPPTYDEIDRAINFTEDELAKIRYLYDDESVLYTQDRMALEIAQVAYNTSKDNHRIRVSRTELENVFSRLAHIVKGLPASQDNLPKNNEFAAYLLIIREVTHHLDFDWIVVERIHL